MNLRASRLSIKFRNISPMSRSCMREFLSNILSRVAAVGSQKEGVHTQSLSPFAPAWYTTRQSLALPSSSPLGTAKYWISDSIISSGTSRYFFAITSASFSRRTSLASSGMSRWGRF